MVAHGVEGDKVRLRLFPPACAGVAESCSERWVRLFDGVPGV